MEQAVAREATSQGRRWRVGRVLTVTALLLFILIYGGRALAGEPIRGHVEGFRQVVETDHRTYAAQEPVEIKVTVCRSRPWPVVTSSGGGTDLLIDFQVLDANGAIVADTSHKVITDELRPVPWLPGMCRTSRHEWDQLHWNREDPFATERVVLGEPVRGEPVPPGGYRVRAVWSSSPWDEPPSRLGPVTGAVFVIEP